jgi:hypothetical protein
MLTKSSAGQSAGPTPSGLVLERLPSGELAWLRPELDAAIADADRLDQDLTRLLDRRGASADERDPRYALTQASRDLLARWRAEFALFGREVS